MVSRVTRFDVGRLGKVDRTPVGGVRVPAHVTRVGVLTYRADDGSVTREFRPPEEVFAPESLATLRAVPVTDLHPDRMVTSANYRELSRGHVADDVRQDGELVAATVVVQDADLIGKIERRDRQEISCGYTAKIDPTPGEWNGERYDQIQREIRYNHVALGPDGWGRAGSDVALRLDAKTGDALPPGGEAHATKTSAPTNGDAKETRSMTIKIDGVEYPLGTDAEKEAAAKAYARERDSAAGRFDALSKELEATKANLAEALDPKRMDAAVSARVALVEQARKLAGETFRADGKTDREVMVAALEAGDATIKLDGRSDEYVRGMFDVAVRSSASRGAVGDLARAHDAAVHAPRTDKVEPHPRDAMIARNAQMWRAEKAQG